MADTESTEHAEYRLVHGDVDLRYGGLFVRDMGDGWAEVVEIEDLDSAVGTTNLVLITQGTVTIPYRFAEARRVFKVAWDACGPGAGGQRLSGMDRITARLATFAAIWEYGQRDVERRWTVATDHDYDESTGAERWRVTRQLIYDERLECNRRMPIVVNGEKGLLRWLRRTLDVEVVR
jgi:hypothetical protein